MPAPRRAALAVLLCAAVAEGVGWPPTPSCKPTLHRLPVGKKTLQYHATNDLTRGGQFKLAVVVQHGTQRNADDYFCIMYNILQKQKYRKPADVVIVAPRFVYQSDGPAASDLYWNTTKPWGDWRAGGESDPGPMNRTPTVSSFDALDSVVLLLNNRRLFPRLDEVAFAGHSAGGQAVLRYAFATHLRPEAGLRPGTDVRFVIANPSSYLYFDKRRWRYSCGKCDCDEKQCKCDDECRMPLHDEGFGIPPPSGGRGASGWVCSDPAYDAWPYGVSSGLVPYAAATDTRAALQAYPLRDVRLLVGGGDQCNDLLPTCNDGCWQKKEGCARNAMDTRCPAMLQGPWRRLRAEWYYNYFTREYNHTVHSLDVVPSVGHDAEAMFGSAFGISAVFRAKGDEEDGRASARACAPRRQLASPQALRS